MAIILAEGAGTTSSFPLSSAGVGVVAICVFALLLGVVFAFRGVSNRH